MVAIELECRVVGNGVMLYLPEPPFYVQERVAGGRGMDGDVGMCLEDHEIRGEGVYQRGRRSQSRDD